MAGTEPEASLKLRTARTLKWNLLDRVGSQILYAVTGIVLARELSQEDFGLVGAILVFQAFASLMVDSGFNYALIQRKTPTRRDYSTVLWFNMGVSVALYVILYICAPWIAGLFGADYRLVPLSRVMFLSFIINGASLVQTARFMKEMNVRPVALANFAGLATGGAVGIVMALKGCGAWSIVWQTIVSATVKTGCLWIQSRWLPLACFSFKVLGGFFRVGGSMMFTSFLNTLFLNIYSFFVGNRVGLVALGYYTQSDKWSKMGVMSVSQTLTSSFLPVLSAVQDEPERFNRICLKMNRMASYIVFPLFIGLIVEAAPIFHILFGTKWDASIMLFQLLLVRGFFTVFTQLYNNYLLALGHAAVIARLEIWRDVVAVAGLAATFPYMAQSLPGNPVWGVTVMLWGQVAAGAVGWLLTVLTVQRRCGVSAMSLCTGYVPYMVLSLALGGVMWMCGAWISSPWLAVAVESAAGAGIYLAVNAALGSTIQKNALAYLRGKL